MPRIAPEDRVLHDAIDAAPPMREPPPHIEPATAAAPAPQSTASGGLQREDLRKLHAVLHELSECRKLIGAAVARPDIDINMDLD